MRFWKSDRNQALYLLFFFAPAKASLAIRTFQFISGPEQLSKLFFDTIENDDIFFCYFGQIIQEIFDIF